jgi:DNA-binding protein HU-beta
MDTQKLIAAVAKKSGHTQLKVKDCIEPILECILEALQNGNRITIYKFGMFYVKEYGERNSRNPYTGESIVIPPKKVIKFKVTPNVHFQ